MRLMWLASRSTFEPGTGASARNRMSFRKSKTSRGGRSPEASTDLPGALFVFGVGFKRKKKRKKVSYAAANKWRRGGG